MATAFRDIDDGIRALDDTSLLALACNEGSVGRRIAALETWVDRHGGGRDSDLAGVLADRAAPTDLRKVAARNLARSARAAASPALFKAVAGADSELFEVLVEEIGRVGERDAFTELGRIEAPDDPRARQSLAFARSLISYRLGLGEALLSADTKTRVARFDRANAETLPTAKTPVPKSLDFSIDGATPAYAVRIRCGRAELVVCATAEAARLGRTNAIAAIVAERSDPSMRFGIALVAFAHRLTDGRYALLAARLHGPRVFAGTAQAEGETLRFELRATESLYFPPTEIVGTLSLSTTQIQLTRVSVDRTGPGPRFRGRQPPRFTIALPPPR